MVGTNIIETTQHAKISRFRFCCHYDSLLQIKLKLNLVSPEPPRLAMKKNRKQSGGSGVEVWLYFSIVLLWFHSEVNDALTSSAFTDVWVCASFSFCSIGGSVPVLAVSLRRDSKLVV